MSAKSAFTTLRLTVTAHTFPAPSLDVWLVAIIVEPLLSSVPAWHQRSAAFRKPQDLYCSLDQSRLPSTPICRSQIIAAPATLELLIPHRSSMNITRGASLPTSSLRLSIPTSSLMIRMKIPQCLLPACDAEPSTVLTEKHLHSKEGIVCVPTRGVMNDVVVFSDLTGHGEILRAERDRCCLLVWEVSSGWRCCLLLMVPGRLLK